MSRLTDLMRQLHANDPQLGADLESEIRALTKRRSFGLVFEQHQPEAVELPGLTPKRGSKVRILRPRGTSQKGDNRLWIVESIKNSEGVNVAQIVELYSEVPQQASVALDELVVVAEFKDVIFPGLIETGRVERGVGKPFHTVINAENFHALEMLTYTHRGKIDAIYIDPPYNTGAKDWKYNNDYVESNDAYRHSKWLAMMERRLLISKELLNPEDSVLIVTIDEKEYLRLGLLLEQTFPEARIQMVSSVINFAGSSRPDSFARTDEYIFFVQLGLSAPSPHALGAEWMTGKGNQRRKGLYWNELLRTGPGASRADSPRLFFPIYLTSDATRFHSVGEAIDLTVDRETVNHPDGVVVRWPLRSDGSEGRWRASPNKVKELINDGHIRLGRPRGTKTTIQYLSRGEINKLRDGTFVVSGTRSDGSVEVDASSYVPEFIPGSQWRVSSHDSSVNGSQLVYALLSKKFPFPKSLYAVEDALRFYVKDKPNATVLDFFAGSGTTAHAVMRLNRQDRGHRQCISVTNNEVSADEQKKLRKKGLRPGDPEWEALGICDYITKPRVTAAITGRRPDGQAIKGDYKFTDEFPMSDGFEENAAFFTLTYESPLSVRHGRAFDRVAPMLWLRAGSQGRIITSLGKHGWGVSDVYAVLENFDAAAEFFSALAESVDIRTVFFITDDDAVFQMACRKLPEGVEPVRLYSSYLQNFEINRGHA